MASINLMNQPQLEKPKKRRVDKRTSRRQLKKPRFMWPNELHDQFVGSIFDIGASRVTADLLVTLAAESGRTVSSTAIDMFLRQLQHYQTHAIIINTTTDAPPAKKPKAIEPTLSPILSAEMLRPYTTSAAFVHKEFPHLKDNMYKMPLQFDSVKLEMMVATPKSCTSADVSIMSPTEINRPLSPLSSDIDSFEFDLNYEVFSSAVIRMYLDA
jgi:hypothetical protein